MRIKKETLQKLVDAGDLLMSELECFIDAGIESSDDKQAFTEARQAVEAWFKALEGYQLDIIPEHKKPTVTNNSTVH